jgi:transcriptional regulator with XRE-family HTH domain
MKVRLLHFRMENDLKQNLTKLGQNISNERVKQNMTQYKLAKDLLMDQSNLGRIEKGLVNPTVNTLIKISWVLNCSVKDFFDF